MKIDYIILMFEILRKCLAALGKCFRILSMAHKILVPVDSCSFQPGPTASLSELSSLGWHPTSHKDLSLPHGLSICSLFPEIITPQPSQVPSPYHFPQWRSEVLPDHLGDGIFFFSPHSKQNIVLVINHEP